MVKAKPTLTRMTATEQRVRTIIKKLKRSYPEAQTALLHNDPLQLLIATILSAQCTDERVNIVTRDLFKKYRSAHDYAGASQRMLEQEIRSTGFFRAKARNLIGCGKALVELHGGKVPNSMEELIRLPGVGRKTANVVLGNAFGMAEGIVVDTHVARLSARLGLSNGKNPERIEADLMELVPRKDWIVFPHLMIWHGRKVCRARSPLCPTCSISSLCPSAFTL